MSSSSFLTQITSVNKADLVSLFISNTVVSLAVKNKRGYAFESASVLTSPWLTACDLIKKYEIKKNKIQIVLSAQLYQSVLIDQPSINSADKHLALPFLVREHVKLPIDDMIVDGFSLPFSERFLAFVCQKSAIWPLIELLLQRNCPIFVSTESIALRQWTHLQRSQLVLTRRDSQTLLLTAYCQGKFCFEWTVLASDLTLISEAELLVQAAEIVAQLQRTLDYLSAQVQQFTFDAVIVNILDLRDHQLAVLLNGRLSLPVRTKSLFEKGKYHEQIALAALQPDHDPLINLFHSDLIPKKPKVTFRRIKSAALFILACGAGFSALLCWQSHQLQSALKVTRGQLQRAKDESAQLTAQLAKHRPAAFLVEAVKQNSAQVEQKQGLLQAMARFKSVNEYSFSQTLAGLSQLADSSISLRSLVIDGAYLDLYGLAKNAQSVPAWVDRFADQPALAKRQFEQLELTYDEKNVAHFKLLSQRKRRGR
ncbi:MAG: hypothetical protein ACRC9T_04115 [Vibrionaceae bacterium]